MPMPEFKQLVNEAKKDIQEIGPEDLQRMRSAAQEFVLIDVREKDDAVRGMIPGAVHISRGMLEHNIDQITTDKDKPIVLYCGGGSRSALSAWMLKKMGFRNVSSLAGGYRGWNDLQNKKAE